MEDRCVICGTIIPEGRMVCPACEDKIKNINHNNIADFVEDLFQIKLFDYQRHYLKKLFKKYKNKEVNKHE